MFYNQQLFRFLNSFASKSQLWDRFFIFGAQYLVFLVMGMVVSLFLLGKGPRKKKTGRFFFIAGGSFVAWLASEAVKIIFSIPRPFQVLKDVSLLIQDLPANFAFPSGHVSLMFAGALACWALKKGWGIFFITCTLVVGLCRVIVGLHWPLDILGGFILGAVVFKIVSEIVKFWKPSLLSKN